jgi:hypothetical protein
LPLRSPFNFGRHARSPAGPFDRLLTASPILIRWDVGNISRCVKWSIQHFQQPSHQSLPASNHVQAALTLMFFQSFLQLLFQVFHTYLHK